METVELACERRETRTKGEVRALRRSGRVPAVVYGAKGVALAVTVPGSELAARVASAARQRLMKLRSDAADLNAKHVILKEVQRAPISGAILHADFYEVDMSARLRLSIPLRFIGKAVGIQNGGILQPLVREVEVECLPLEIPEYVEVDVTPLDIHDVIHVSTVKFPGQVRPLFDTDYAVVSVLPPTVEEAPVAAAAAEAVPAEGEAAEGTATAATTSAPASGAEAGAKEAAPAAKKAEVQKK
jgi:large subunit ribosomal protein L25